MTMKNGKKIRGRRTHKSHVRPGFEQKNKGALRLWNRDFGQKLEAGVITLARRKRSPVKKIKTTHSPFDVRMAMQRYCKSFSDFECPKKYGYENCKLKSYCDGREGTGFFIASRFEEGAEHKPEVARILEEIYSL